MEKYISDKVLNTILKNEQEKRGTGSVFFSSKEKTDSGEDNEEFFNSYAGQKLRVVGMEPATFTSEEVKDAKGKVTEEARVQNYNVVIFDDGHQLSTSRFFTAKGLHWPVGGNVAKATYLAKAINSGVAIEVIPESVSVSGRKSRDGKPFNLVSYKFQDCDLPALEEEA